MRRTRRAQVFKQTEPPGANCMQISAVMWRATAG
jgi:hypothetical protein